jgi:hypothetical protein
MSKSEVNEPTFLRRDRAGRLVAAFAVPALDYESGYEHGRMSAREFVAFMRATPSAVGRNLLGRIMTSRSFLAPRNAAVRNGFSVTLASTIAASRGDAS